MDDVDRYIEKQVEDAKRSTDYQGVWDPTTIRENAHKWCLAGDAGLLNYLNQLSGTLISNGEAAAGRISATDASVEEASSSLSCVLSDFMMLANTQFMENRVYDEDVTVPEVKEDTPVAVPSEAEFVENARKMMSLSSQMVNRYFTRIDVRPQDFDEDDDPTFRPDPIFEAKNPYMQKPLPYVIGSSDFLSSPHVGLIETPEEEEDVPEEPEPEVQLQPSTEIPIPKDIPPAPPFMPTSAESGTKRSDSSGLFDDTGARDSDSLFDEASPVRRVEDKGPPEPSDFRADLSQKLKFPPRAPDETRPGSTRPQEPSDEEDVPPPPPAVEKPSPKVVAQVEPRTGVLFGDSDDEEDLFVPVKKTQVTLPKKSPQQKKPKGLFDDDSESDSDQPPPLIAPRRAPPQDRSAKVDRPESLHSNKPFGAVSLFGDAASKITSSIEERATAGVRPKPEPSPVLSGVTPGSSTPSTPFGSGIFAVKPDIAAQPQEKKSFAKTLFDSDDSDEDDLFAQLAKTKSKSKPLPSAQIPAASSQPKMAVAQPRPAAPAPAPKVPEPQQPSRPNTARLFGDDSSDKDTFGAPPPSKPISTSIPAPKPRVPKAEAEPQPSTSKSAGLFSDSDDDLFDGSTSTKPGTSKESIVPTRNDSEPRRSQGVTPPAVGQASESDMQKKPPPGAVSLFGGGGGFAGELRNKLKQRRSADDDDLEPPPLSPSPTPKAEPADTIPEEYTPSVAGHGSTHATEPPKPPPLEVPEPTSVSESSESGSNLLSAAPPQIAAEPSSLPGLNTVLARPKPNAKKRRPPSQIVKSPGHDSAAAFFGDVVPERTDGQSNSGLAVSTDTDTDRQPESDDLPTSPGVSPKESHKPNFTQPDSKPSESSRAEVTSANEIADMSHDTDQPDARAEHVDKPVVEEVEPKRPSPDLFENASTDVPETKVVDAPTSAQKTTGNVFDSDSEEDLFPSVRKNINPSSQAGARKNIPPSSQAGAGETKTVLKPGEAIKTAISKVAASAQENISSASSAGASGTEKVVKTAGAIGGAIKTTASKVSALFDSDSDDDIFKTSQSQPASQGATVHRSQVKPSDAPPDSLMAALPKEGKDESESLGPLGEEALPALGDLSRDRYNIWTMLGADKSDKRYKELQDARRQYREAVTDNEPEDAQSENVPETTEKEPKKQKQTSLFDDSDDDIDLFKS